MRQLAGITASNYFIDGMKENNYNIQILCPIYIYTYRSIVLSIFVIFTSTYRALSIGQQMAAGI